MANHSAWARHKAKDCKEKCFYCQHPPVVKKPLLSKNSKLSYDQLTALAVSYKHRLEQIEQPGLLVKAVTNPALIQAVQR